MTENLHIVVCAMIIESIEDDLISAEEVLNTTCFAQKIIKIDSSEKAICYFEKIKNQEPNVSVPDVIFLSDNLLMLLDGQLGCLEEFLFLTPKWIVLSNKEDSPNKDRNKYKKILKEIPKPLNPANLYSEDLLKMLNFQ